MEREELILKWLNNDLTAPELEAFKQLKDYEALTTLNSHLQGFKPNNYNVSEELDTLLKTIETRKKTKKNWLPIMLRVAAVIVVCLGIFYYTTTLDTQISTVIAEKQTIELPDASTVAINAKSTITYNKHNWDDSRNVTLDGEAYFEVAKGSKFDVIAPNGVVSVLGTKFNVDQRNNTFEVVCYEGLVQVVYGSYNEKLPAGNRLLSLDGKLVANEEEIISEPSWINKQSTFKSLPYKEVIAEFERQYDIRIDTQNVNDTQLFTGSFTHNNLDVALKSITLPLQLTYTKTGKTILLQRE